jgi:meiotic recombination protein REC8
MFPWDNAGASSSAGGGPLGLAGEGSGRISIDRADIKLRGRGSSLSQRDSSLVPSHVGSAAGIGFSPMAFGNSGAEEDFAFERE